MLQGDGEFCAFELIFHINYTLEQRSDNVLDSISRKTACRLRLKRANDVFSYSLTCPVQRVKRFQTTLSIKSKPNQAYAEYGELITKLRDRHWGMANKDYSTGR